MSALLGVTLLHHTPEPERAVAIAGRLCYAPVSAADLQEEMDDEAVAKLVHILVRSGHHSALEHAAFTFAIDGVSRACTHQLVRHRLASYSQRSQRYVKENEPRFIEPTEITNDTAANQIFLSAMGNAWAAYSALLKNGVRPELARYVLPGACETQIVITMNFRELRHFIKLRASKKALPEMQAVAGKIRDIMKKEAPQVFADL